MLDLIVFVVLLLLGFIIGSMVEKNHYRSIIKRETLLRNLPLIASKKLPDEFTPCNTRLVAGNVVISVDFFKKFVAGLRSLIGGRMSSYESLIDRARREALLRMREDAKQAGAHYVFNIKMETTSLYKGQHGAIGSVEVLAYGTAVILVKNCPEAIIQADANMMNLRPG